MQKVIAGAVEEQFDRNKSVFKPWDKDTPKILDKARLKDIEYWGAWKAVKNTEGDYDNVLDLIELYYPSLKHMYVILISCDSYP